MRLAHVLLAAALMPPLPSLAQGQGLTLSQALSLAARPAAAMTANDAPLDLDEALGLALEAQPQIARLAARLRGLEEEARAEGELPDPRLTLGLTNLPVDTFSFTQEDMTQFMVGVSQMVPGGDKRRLASRRTSVEADRMRSELAEARLQITREVSLAWLDLYYPRQALELLGRIEQEISRQVEWASVALASGGLSQADALAARLTREYVIDQQAELQRDEARARLQLARWVGEAAARPPAGGPLPAAPAMDPASREAALRSHPELDTLAQAVALARAETDLARESYKPDWSVDMGYGLRGGGRTDMFSVQVGVELPIFPKQRQDRRVAARLAAAEGAESELEDRRRQLAARLGAALADWQAADRRVAHFDATLIPLAQRRVDSALAAYRTGKTEFAAVVEARRAELEARLQRLGHEVARARAAVELRYYLAEQGSSPAPQPASQG
jgi:outer membrane protein TolC